MSAKCLLLSLILASVSFLMVYAHMILEEKPASNGSCSAHLQEQTHSDTPSILIEEIPKTMKKPDKKQKKNNFSTKNNRPPPPGNCVPSWGSCKRPNSVCCEYCAFCQCRLFKTVCYCRMGNPRC
ncbi:agouti signaling protein 1 [Brienomyrus brachyistius]|uniref:agouti signaling protein 1 n=1 Tax=Brienomyrus brachyistius TaxID=42636 RepID=UPI0020B4464B|nr:agouti signaling protein 1 [Brienomyrus brachyistius]